jgi:hypothetical protein
VEGNVVSLSDDEEYRVWLIWKLEGDRPILVAIDTSEARAAQHLAGLKYEAEYLDRPPPETFVEESKLNHLYGQSVTDLKSFKISKLMQKWKKQT